MKTPEQIVKILHNIEGAVKDGQTVAEACEDHLISESRYLIWRQKYGGLKVEQVRRMKKLEQENASLKRLVAELSLAKLALKDMVSKNI